ncbi:MAG: aminopeptidase N [Gammaproteobacteria bacterium]|nr:aminopeptidase N [Gammaproteobacteria bacterium]
MSRIESPILTAEQADYRSGLVSDVRYFIDLSLNATSADYTGTVVAEFTLAESQKALTLDFSGGEVYSVEVNGTQSAFVYNGAWIGLDADRLEEGPNKVLVHFTHPYSSDGAGLQRTTDPEDGQVYVYTHFEPYDANRLFPCFDQPDLKARFRLSVSAPADWEIISAAHATAITILSPGIRDWEFSETLPFSTYLFSLHAGPYTVWESQAGNTPLRLFARPTLAPYVDAEDWFKLTRDGFSFYEALFEIPYPFEKYDQIIVPDLNIGAMENVAAVTYNEAYVTRSAPTLQQQQRHAEVLLHEMAHMWFGNLVTPQWWDGLWLKEALATYLSHIAMAATTRLDDPTQRFFAGGKQSAYRADERETRHPIDVKVSDTHVAFANFDSITYEKGSSALTQLSHFVGQNAFHVGMRQYLKNNAWDNTRLEDFIRELEKSSGKNLQDWMQSWLRSAGVNTIIPSVVYENGKISAFSLLQTAPGGVPLRKHTLQVALFYENGDAKELQVAVEGEKTALTEAVGLAAPTLILVNHSDWSFVRTELDPLTLKNFYAHIGSVQQPLARAMLWQSLWEMVRNANYPLPAYIDLLTQHVITEPDNLLTLQLTRAMNASRDYLLRGLGQKNELALRGVQRLEDAAWEALNAMPPGSERQKTWLEKFIRLASSSQYLQHLEAFLEGHRIPQGMVIDADTRWDILRQLNSFAFNDFESRTDMEALRDKSDRGRKRAIEVTAIRPDPDIKQVWIDGLLDNSDFMPLGQMRYGMRSLFPEQQLELMEPHSERILASLQKLGVTRDDAFLRQFSRLIPATCSEKSIKRLESALGLQSLHPILERAIRNALDEDRRCVAISKLALASAS